MKLFKNKAIVTAIIAVMIMLLAACGKKEEPAADPTPAATATPTAEPTKEPTPTPTEAPTPTPTEEPTPEPTETPEVNPIVAALNGTQWVGVDEGTALAMVFGEAGITLYTPDEDNNYNPIEVTYTVDDTALTINYPNGISEAFTCQAAPDLSQIALTNSQGVTVVYQAVPGGIDELNAALAVASGSSEKAEPSVFEGTIWAGVQDGIPTGFVFTNGSLILVIPSADGSFSQIPCGYTVEGNNFTALMGATTKGLVFELADDLSTVDLFDPTTGETATFTRVEGGEEELTATLSSMMNGSDEENEDEEAEDEDGEEDENDGEGADEEGESGSFADLEGTVWAGIDNGTPTALIFSGANLILVVPNENGELAQLPCEFSIDEENGIITVVTPDGTEQTNYISIEEDWSALSLIDTENEDETIYSAIEGGYEGIPAALSQLIASMQ